MIKCPVCNTICVFKQWIRYFYCPKCMCYIDDFGHLIRKEDLEQN